MKEVPITFVDNRAAVRLAQKLKFYSKTKRISLKNFLIREKMLEEEINVQ